MSNFKQILDKLNESSLKKFEDLKKFKEEKYQDDQMLYGFKDDTGKVIVFNIDASVKGAELAKKMKSAYSNYEYGSSKTETDIAKIWKDFASEMSGRSKY